MSLFSCPDGCNHCCIWRDYYVKPNAQTIHKDGKVGPATEPILGKRGTELDANEVWKYRKYAHKLRHRVDEKGDLIRYDILPDKGISVKGAQEPDKIISYQLMGRTKDGDICPFLSTVNEGRYTPTGALACLVYEDRPSICRSYPVNRVIVKDKRKLASIDNGCQWVGRNFERWMLEPFDVNYVRGLDYATMIRVQTGRVFDPDKLDFWIYATPYYNAADEASSIAGKWVNWGWS